ncbi:MAG: menaquinone biosynthesis protein [Pirellulaceae bacterium]|nr:menaquinone biosynthesis protein [Pirellulaceae bacterium]
MDYLNKVHIGAVSYLNSKPLVYGLEGCREDIDITYDLPSELADSLGSGELDVALIPSFEYFRDPTYSIVSDVCVACEGPVWSVKLYSRKPLRQIQTLALDEGSRSSSALAQILLYERFGIKPTLQKLRVKDALQDVDADAYVVIGDRAMYPTGEVFVQQWDLGREWQKMTNLPFVFAMWVARYGANLKEIDQILENCRQEGLKNIDKIIAQESPRLKIPPKKCESYFTKNLHFTLGKKEKESLMLFYEYALKMEFVTEGIELNFYEPIS